MNVLSHTMSCEVGGLLPPGAPRNALRQVHVYGLLIAGQMLPKECGLNIHLVDFEVFSYCENK